jgi:DNA-binding XRE family transcriptional regulator
MLKEKIIEIRQKKRLTQAEFGEVLGIPQFTISRIERGQQEVDLKMLIGLAKHFDVNLHELTLR